MPHRVFVAVDLDDAARGAIAHAIDPLRTALARAEAPLRWVPPEQWHITLAFMPAVDDEGLARLRAELGAPFGEAPFDLAFGGVGLFPQGGAPRVLWMGIEAGVAELRALAAAVRQRLRQAGLVTEDRSFSPHLTLARWKASRGGNRRLVSGLAIGRAARVRVVRTVLYESHLSSSGAAHQPLLETALA